VAYPIVRLLQRSGLVSMTLPPAIPEFVSLGISGAEDRKFNGYTFLYYPLVDFGPAGALVYAGVIGLIVGLAYGWTRRNRSAPLRLLVMGQLSTALVLSIFVSKFNNTASWYVVVLTALPFLLARTRNAPDA
jgi:oligosaccharide repeat unit polymerase